MPWRLLIAFLLFAPLVNADENEADKLVKQLRTTYDKIAVELRGVKDKRSAENALKSLDMFAAKRDQEMKDFDGLKLSPVERSAAQKRLTEALAPVKDAVAEEVVRISLDTELLAAIGKHAVVQEVGRSLDKAAKIGALSLDKAVVTWTLKNDGEFPKKLADVARYLSDPRKALRDPWGREWHYDPAGKKNGRGHPDIWTVSPFGGGTRLIGNFGEGK